MVKTLLFLGLLCIPLSGWATHIIGGEITYECEGYNESDDTYTYNITLTVYNDCGPANVNNTFFDDIASVGIFEEDETLFQNLSINYPGTFTFIDTELNNPCISSPASACVRKAVYESSVDLTFENGGYDVVYQRCCRNWSISNINSAGITGMTLNAFIPEPIDDECNSSPSFDVLPPAFLCIDYDFELDFSASDLDSDSLVYELCTPFYGATVDIPQPSPPDPPPFGNVGWSAGYDELTPFETVNGLVLDSETGILTGTPEEIGIFAIAICVKEYRNGELISSIFRDYQINIYNCPAVVESYFSDQGTVDMCSGLEISFENNSSNSSAFFWDFGIEGLESDTSIQEEPTFTFSEPGVYQVTLIAEPGGECADTSYQEYTVNNPITIFFNNPEIICDTLTTFNFSGLGDYSDTAIFQWNFGSLQTSDVENPGEVTFPGPGSYNVIYNVIDGACLGNYISEVVIPENVEAGIVPQSEFCNGLDVSFQNASINAQSYQWTFGEDGDEIYSSQNSPSISFNEPGSFPVSLIASNVLACPDTANDIFEVYPYMMPYFEVPVDVYCFDDHEVVLVADGIFQDFAVILWDFGPSASQMASGDIVTPIISYEEPGSYPVTLTVFENGCEKNYTQNVEIHPNPLASFTLLDSSGCKPLNVQFLNLSEAWTPLNYSWNFGNGAFSQEQNPSSDYTFSGFFYPSLTVSTSSGCIGESSYTLEWPIHVFPLPQANFSIEPNIVDILDPEVYIEDLSQSSTSTFYNFSNGDSTGLNNFAYTFEDAGVFSITQTVWNEYGCSDQVTGGVKVNGFLFFLPNSFTPNGDGYNDVLRPEYTGISTYSLQIFDRWGQKIFSSNDPGEGWDGMNAADGVYNYFIKLQDLTLLPHHFSGSITLIR